MKKITFGMVIVFGIMMVGCAPQLAFKNTGSDTFENRLKSEASTDGAEVSIDDAITLKVTVDSKEFDLTALVKDGITEYQDVKEGKEHDVSLELKGKYTTKISGVEYPVDLGADSGKAIKELYETKFSDAVKSESLEAGKKYIVEF